MGIRDVEDGARSENAGVTPVVVAHRLGGGADGDVFYHALVVPGSERAVKKRRPHTDEEDMRKEVEAMQVLCATRTRQVFCPRSTMNWWRLHERVAMPDPA